MTADIAIEPEEGIERFRYLVASRADFDYTAFEGEASVRRMIIGHWDDLTNESTKAITVNATGLKPNTEYQVGIVGFDDKSCAKRFCFTTSRRRAYRPQTDFGRRNTDCRNSVEQRPLSRSMRLMR